MPDPIPLLLCAGAYLAAGLAVALMPVSIRVMRNAAIGLLVCVPIIALLKLAHAADSSEGSAGALGISSFFAVPSALPSLPLLGAGLIAKGMNDRRAASWGMVGGIVGGGALMTAIMSIDLSADALNSIGIAFGPALAAVGTLVGGRFGVALWWAIVGRRARTKAS